MQSTYSGGKVRCFFKGGKDRVFEIINSSSLVFDVVCSSSAKGGTSTVEKQDRQFFSEELVEPLN